MLKVVDDLLRRHSKRVASWYLSRTIPVAVLLIVQFLIAAPAFSQNTISSS